MPRIAKSPEELEQRRLVGNAANKAWRAANPERQAELTKRWRIKNADRAREVHNIWVAANREATRRIANKWARANPAQRKLQMAKLYETSDKELRKIEHKKWRDKRQLAQAGRPKPAACEVCGRQPGKNGLHFDHCHATKKFRGWLCHGCNIALGGVNDSVEILMLLAKFLKNHKPKIAPKKGTDK